MAMAMANRRATTSMDGAATGDQKEREKESTRTRDGGTNGSGATLKTGNGMGAKAAHLPIQGEGHQLSYVRTTRVDTTCHTVRGTSMLR